MASRALHRPQAQLQRGDVRRGVADYSRWDSLRDSDDERQAVQDRDARANVARREVLAAEAPSPPKVDWSRVKLDDPATLGDMPDGMAQYMRAVACGQFGAGKADYRPPETEGEKRAKAAEAAALKQQGNALFAQGERFEAAKLYEQAVLKFDWFSDALADEAERALVLPVKLPCHLNLALCSVQLGNYAHAAVHCTQVLRHEPGNAKALFRRGVCHTHLGQLEEARADLLAARQRLPADAKLHDALAKLRLKGEEYRRRSQRMSHRMIHALSESDSEGAGAASEAREHGAARESRDGAETLARADGKGEEDGSSRDDVGAPASAPAPEGQRGRRAAVCLATAAAARGAVRESPVVLGPMALPAHRVASAYACADCARDGAEHDTPALLHPVLGLICPTCRLVLCASSER